MSGLRGSRPGLGSMPGLREPTPGLKAYIFLPSGLLRTWRAFLRSASRVLFQAMATLAKAFSPFCVAPWKTKSARAAW